MNHHARYSPTHHACETPLRYCQLCDDGSTPLAVLTTIECHTAQLARIVAATLNTAQSNPSYAWLRSGSTVQLD